jgi:4'-phosphopantetheinyl transferase
LVVCGVMSASEIGVDVEYLDRATNCLELARRFFAPVEAAALAAAPVSRQRAEFLRYWTLKEAFIKARGMGLAIPLDDFWFTLVEQSPPRIAFRADSPLDPGGWQFGLIRFGSDHQMAFAVPLSASSPITVRLRETTPLRWKGDWRILPGRANRQWQVEAPSMRNDADHSR